MSEKETKKELKLMAKKMKAKKIMEGPDAGKFGMYGEDGGIVKTFHSKKMNDTLESRAEADRDAMCSEMCDMGDLKLGEPEMAAGVGGNIVGGETVAPKALAASEVPAPAAAAPVAALPVAEIIPAAPATPAAIPAKGIETMSEKKTTAVLLSECMNTETGRLDVEKVVNLAATVTGSVNTGYTWSLVSGPGTLTSAGVYTAPSSVTSAQTVVIHATSVLNTAAAGDAKTTFQPDPVYGTATFTISTEPFASKLV